MDHGKFSWVDGSVRLEDFLNDTELRWLNYDFQEVLLMVRFNMKKRFEIEMVYKGKDTSCRNFRIQACQGHNKHVGDKIKRVPGEEKEITLEE